MESWQAWAARGGGSAVAVGRAVWRRRKKLREPCAKPQAAGRFGEASLINCTFQKPLQLLEAHRNKLEAVRHETPYTGAGIRCCRAGRVGLSGARTIPADLSRGIRREGPAVGPRCGGCRLQGDGS